MAKARCKRCQLVGRRRAARVPAEFPRYCSTRCLVSHLQEQAMDEHPCPDCGRWTLCSDECQHCNPAGKPLIDVL